MKTVRLAFVGDAMLHGKIVKTNQEKFLLLKLKMRREKI